MKKKANYLDNIPAIGGDIVWEKDDENLVIVVQEHEGIYSKIAQKFFSSPKQSKIHLDAFGSFVWLQIDGESDIYEIGKKVKDQFGKKAEPLYERLSTFFATLKDVGFITFKNKEEK